VHEGSEVRDRRGRVLWELLGLERLSGRDSQEGLHFQRIVDEEGAGRDGLRGVDLKSGTG
jgi:hypothetical protein